MTSGPSESVPLGKVSALLPQLWKAVCLEPSGGCWVTSEKQLANRAAVPELLGLTPFPQPWTLMLSHLWSRKEFCVLCLRQLEIQNYIIFWPLYSTLPSSH